MLTQEVFAEDRHGMARHVMGIVHDAAHYLPDLLDHMGETHPGITVKNGIIGSSNKADIETQTMASYVEQVSTMAPEMQIYAHESGVGPEAKSGKPARCVRQTWWALYS